MGRKSRFSSFLRDARIKRRLTVAEVADRVGVSMACVYLWEEGRTRPRDRNLVALCKALKLPIDTVRLMLASERA